MLEERESPGAPRPLTILQVTPELNAGGVERGTLEIAQAIRAARGRALVMSAGGRMASRFRTAGAELILAPVASKNPLRIRANARRMAEIITREGVDIIHARSRAPAWSALWAARETGAKFVTTYHGVYTEDLPFKKRYNSVMAAGDVVIAISKFIAEHIKATHETPESRITVIPRGADVSVFSENAVSAARVVGLAERWGVADDSRPVLMLPGRLTRWKGQTLFLEALATLRARVGPTAFHAIIVGSEKPPKPGRAEKRRPTGRFEAQLHAEATRLGLSDCVTFTGHCDDMPAALKLASYVISASIEPEAFGRIAVEAQAMGVPVLASAHGGALETVSDGVTGWLYDPNDAEILAQALEYVLTVDPETRRRMGRAGATRVQSMFTVANMQAETLSLYERIAGRFF